LYLLILFCGIITSGYAQVAELRGTWLAWAGGSVPSTEIIVQTMDSLAFANFNVVYVDVWRFGYPYFRSKIFHDLTGYYTDPNVETYYQPSRDVLAEMVVEGHRVGLEVEAWFESGFNGAVSESSPLYQQKSAWLAHKRDGSVASYQQAGPSLIQCHPEVQQFLIDMCQEVIRNYDIDGVDMDRIRYPELDCGYDPVTVALYKGEHGGTAPPDNIADPQWKQWRADKLTEFMGRMFDSLKVINPKVTISNAPLPWGPEQFCQDWAPWINNGYLDLVIPQMYYTTNDLFTWRLSNELQYVNNDELVYPGISTIANSEYTTPDELVAMIETIRDRGLHGYVIWYHANLIWHTNHYLGYLRQTVQTESSQLPYRETPWRRPAIIVSETSDNCEKTAGWKSYSGGIPLYEGSCLYTSSGAADTVRYYADIPQSDWYELYVFVNRQTQATSGAPYQIYTDQGNFSRAVNQKISGNSGRWEKIWDIYLEAGSQKFITELTASNANGSYVFADAIMLLNSNRPEEYLTAMNNPVQANQVPDTFVLQQNFPNPFNSSTTIGFSLPEKAFVGLVVYSLQGEQVVTLLNRAPLPAGRHQFTLSEPKLSSGIYFYQLSTPNGMQTRKMILLK
jgi:uncharacterized lipoprotein YddW (UPF0748 family)